MKVVWLVLTAAALLSPAATQQFQLDRNCQPLTGPPFEYNDDFYTLNGKDLSLSVTCTSENISVSWLNDPSTYSYRIEYTCQEDNRTVLARHNDDLNAATLSWRDVNTTSCRFYGAYTNDRVDSSICFAIMPVIIIQTDCLILEPPTSLVSPSTTFPQGPVMSSTLALEESPSLTPQATTPTPPSGGIVVYVPVLIVILVFVVLIAATIAGIALFKYESRRLKLYKSHIYFVDEVDPDFNPVKIHSTVTISPSMETIFHGLEVEYCNKKPSGVEDQAEKENPSLIPSDLLIAKLSDFKPTDKIEAKSRSTPAQNGQVEAQIQSPLSSKSGYITEQPIKADVKIDSLSFDLNDETDTGLAHSLQVASSDSKAAVVKISSSGGYSYNDGSVVIQNVVPAGNKSVALQSSSSASSGYVTEQSTKANIDFDSALGSDCLTYDLNDDENLQSLQPIPYGSNTATVMNLQAGHCSLHLDESSEGHSTSANISVTASSGYVTDTSDCSPYVAESDIESSVPEVFITSGDDADQYADILNAMFPGNTNTAQNGEISIQSSSSASGGYVTEQPTKADVDLDSALGSNCLTYDLLDEENLPTLQAVPYDSKIATVMNVQAGHCSLGHDESPEGRPTSSNVSAIASSGYVTDTTGSSPYVAESNTGSLVPEVCITLGDDTDLEYGELEIETEPLSYSEHQTISGDYIPSPTSVTAATGPRQQSISSGCKVSRASAQDTSQHQTSTHGNYVPESNPLHLNINRQVSVSDSDGYVYSSELADSKTVLHFDRQNSMSTSSGYVYATDESADTTAVAALPLTTSDECSIPLFELEVPDECSSYGQHSNVHNCIELPSQKDAQAINAPSEVEAAVDGEFDWDIESPSCSNSSYVPETKFTNSSTLSNYVTAA